MSDSPSTRRSTRQRVPTQKVAEYKDLSLEKLIGDDSDEEQYLNNEALDDDDDSEFPIEAASNEHDVESAVSYSEVESADESNHPTEEEDNEDIISQAELDEDVLPRVHSAKKRSVAQNPLQGLGRLQFNCQRDSASDATRFDQTHRATLRMTHRHWWNESCLPSCKKMRLPFMYDNVQIGREAQEGWAWYFDESGEDSFSKRQEMRSLSADEGHTHLPGATHDLLVGPYSRQRLVNLHHLEALPLDATEYSTVDSATIPEIETDAQSNGREKRLGWMLNIGTTLQCLDWVPNNDTNTQYLALASSAEPVSFFKHPSPTAPAFTAAPPTPSSIQIWSFDTTEALTPPFNHQPGLLQVLSTEWGTITHLKWCPMPRTHRKSVDQDQAFLGLLATVSADGYARVLSINLILNDPSAPTTYLQISTAPFSIRPPASITTALAWLSPHHIATGHADGSISVHDISLPPNSSSSPSAHPQTIINIPPPIPPAPALVLTPAHPLHPTLLATSSISGNHRLLDLRYPTTDYNSLPRTRYPFTNLIYSPHFACFLHNDDGEGTLRSISVGGWGLKGGSVRLGNLYSGYGPGLAVGANGAQKSGVGKGSGGDLDVGIGPLGSGCLDAGKVHPCVAWGGPDGRVMVTNPMLAVAGKKRRGKGVGDLVVCVFRLEWVRRRQQQQRPKEPQTVDEGERIGAEDVEMGDAGVEGGVAHADADDAGAGGKSGGISRITQSYGAEKVDIGPSQGKKLRSVGVFEEEGAVTAVSWNPNLRCGGWLAVGWGNGIVRVEDVAL